MTKVKSIFNATIYGTAFALCSLLFVMSFAHADATVVQRDTVSKTKAAPSRGISSTTARMPTQRITPVAETPVETIPEEVTEEIVSAVADKSDQFDAAIGTTASTRDTAAESMAEMIRRQRAALDAADATSTATQKMTTATQRGANPCDTGLRNCMKQACGNDFAKCAGDGDTIWGNKLNTCRRDVVCTGEEFTLFTKEIKADRDLNAQLSVYTNVIDCGNRYNNCVFTQCGTNLSKCLGKASGDKTIAACATIARECQTMDSGFGTRTMQVFGILRQNAEVQIAKDEKRLYELRELMYEQCRTLGALFDERSLDCVYTASFFAEANKKQTLFASKKLYAGDSFDCTPNWFGIDITTFKENAERLTRSQTGASSALMGAGLGTAAGAISSGAIGRAMDTQKANKALDAAKSDPNMENAAAAANKAEKSGGGLLNKIGTVVKDKAGAVVKDLTKDGGNGEKPVLEPNIETAKNIKYLSRENWHFMQNVRGLCESQRGGATLKFTSEFGEANAVYRCAFSGMTPALTNTISESIRRNIITDGTLGLKRWESVKSNNGTLGSLTYTIVLPYATDNASGNVIATRTTTQSTLSAINAEQNEQRNLFGLQCSEHDGTMTSVALSGGMMFECRFSDLENYAAACTSTGCASVDDQNRVAAIITGEQGIATKCAEISQAGIPVITSPASCDIYLEFTE